MKKHLILFIFLSFTAGLAMAGDIYTWTDAKGVKRFSDHPPQSATEVKVIESIRESDPTQSDQPVVREEYRRMVEVVTEENRQSELEKQQKAEAMAAEQRKKEEAEKQARKDSDRQLLQDRIDALNNRALGSGFTEGMRQNQINAIQRLIDQMDHSKEGKSN